MKHLPVFWTAFLWQNPTSHFFSKNLLPKCWLPNWYHWKFNSVFNYVVSVHTAQWRSLKKQIRPLRFICSCFKTYAIQATMCRNFTDYTIHLKCLSSFHSDAVLSLTSLLILFFSPQGHINHLSNWNLVFVYLFLTFVTKPFFLNACI